MISRLWRRLSPSTRRFSIGLAAGPKSLRNGLEARLKNYPIYFDHQATTPIDPRVLDVMLPFYMQRFGNAHSKTHKYGEDAGEQVEIARNVSFNLYTT